MWSSAAFGRGCLLGAFLFILTVPALAAPGQARLIAPSGEVTGSTVVFTWAAVPSSTWYRFWFGSQTGTTYQPNVVEWYTAEQAGCPSGGTCSISLTLGYPPGPYVWFIQTWDSTGAGPWSVGKTFATKELTPTWSRRLEPANRFTLVFDGLGVLDNETGLSWARTPSTSTFDWDNAGYRCQLLSHGGRGGWRMPSMSEILSLTYTTLPAGHPFALGASPTFWTATSYGSSGNMLVVTLSTTTVIAQAPKTTQFRVWCVRGPGLELR